MNTTEIITKLEALLDSTTPSHKKALIDKLNDLLGTAEEAPAPTTCPRCHGESFVKKGRTKTGQRYLCCGCERTFGTTTNKVLGMSKLDRSTWRDFVTCFVDGVSLRRSAKRCDVSVKPAFFMRHRVLENIEKNTSKPTIGEGKNAYIDETYFPLNYKGTTPIGRKPRKRGRSSGVRELSKNLVCVVMGTTSTGENFHQLAGCGALSKKRARLALGDVVQENAHINTDKASAYDGLFEKLGATHSSWDSQEDKGELSHPSTLSTPAQSVSCAVSTVLLLRTSPVTCPGCSGWTITARRTC